PRRGIKKSTADGYLNVFKSMFKYLRHEGIYTNDPTEGIDYFNVDNTRLLWLLPDQFLRVIGSCESEPWYVKPIIIVATLTGLRRANVLCLEWSEVVFRWRVY